MTSQYINHDDIARFADQRVNLKRDNANKMREQAKGLRDKLDNYLREHPDFALKRMMLSGSLAKSTSLASTSDIDVALYVSNADAPGVEDLADWMVQKLRGAYPNKDPSDIQPQRYSACIHYRGTGLDVDVVPILYDGDENWDGDLVNKTDGSKMNANIPRQLEFFANRKSKAGSQNYRQVVRLIKYWSKRKKAESENFRCKSFLVELLIAHLFDNNRIDVDDYPLAMRQFFDALASGLLRNRIAFSDYYPLSTIAQSDALVQVIDPVNKTNNVTSEYETHNLDAIESAALEAADAIVAAEDAPTKQESLSYWRQVFGNSFTV